MPPHDRRPHDRTTPSAHDARLARALELHKSGRWQEAAGLYLEVLAARPAHPTALHLLGEVSCRLGDPETGVALMRRAVALKPDYTEALNNLGVQLLALGRADEAIGSFRAATRGRTELIAPLLNLAGALRATGQLAEAERAYAQLTRKLPASADLHSDLGVVRAALGRTDEARASYQRALELSPGHPGALNNLGTLDRAAGRLDAAEALFRRSLDRAPDHAEALHNLGEVLLARGRTADAVVSLRQCLSVRPDFAEAWNTLGHALRHDGDDAAGEAAYREALRAQPAHAGALNSLGLLHWNHGDLGPAIGAFREALRHRPDFAAAHSNLLFALHGDPDITPAGLLAESRAFEQRHPPLPLAAPVARDRDPARRLRVGYLSPDFRRHSCAYFLEALLAAHDRAGFELFAYAEVRQPDAVTARLRGLVDHWRPTVGLSDAALAALIRADHIDVLVDLAGHSADNRLTVLGARPAPVQVTWLGYPGTTGLSTLDARLTDALCDPAGAADEAHSEALVRLPDGMHCYLPPDDAPEVSASPCATRGHVTFGSFNQLAKMNAGVVDAWARVLHQVEDSRLRLKSTALAQPAVRRRVLADFAARGIAPDRLDLLAWTASTRDHLALYADVDVALDPFPYNGTATTCEALWMGVPVIALAGDRHAARVGLSLLSLVGRRELVASSVDDYVAVAVALARDPDRLAAQRATLRDAMRASPLCDAPRFARAVEAAYRRLWTAAP